MGVGVVLLVDVEGVLLRSEVRVVLDVAESPDSLHLAEVRLLSLLRESRPRLRSVDVAGVERQVLVVIHFNAKATSNILMSCSLDTREQSPSI